MHYFKLSIPYIVTVGFFLFLWGCEPKVNSILHPETKITRDGLQLELDIIEASITNRIENLEQQERLREVIFNNAILLSQGAQLNPVGILTALAGVYGVGSAARDTKNVIKRKIINREENVS